MEEYKKTSNQIHCWFIIITNYLDFVINKVNDIFMAKYQDVLDDKTSFLMEYNGEIIIKIKMWIAYIIPSIMFSLFHVCQKRWKCEK